MSRKRAANKIAPAPSKDCGLCLNPAALVDSHIFPRWMGKEIRDDGPLLSIPTHADSDPRFVHRHGEYDQIVCDPCEQSFGPSDDHFADFSRSRHTAKILTRGNTNAHVFTGWDQGLIQRFFLTCLFRAHLSSRSAYRRVDLGPHGERLRLELLPGKSGLVPGFEVTLFRETHVLADAIVVPVRTRVDGTNMYRMSVPAFSAIIRVDQRPILRTFAKLALGEWPEIYAVELNELHPNLLEAMANAELLHGERINRMIAVRPSAS